MLTEQEVREFIAENDVKFIRLAFVDLFGTLKNLAIMPSELHRAFEGKIGFDASAVKGFGEVGHSDLFLKPDPDTLTLLPWRPQTGRVARMMCDCVNPDGTLFSGYSRYILRRQVEQAAKEGYYFRIGTEYEFYLFQADEQGNMTRIPQDQAGYMDVSPMDHGENIRREICLMLEAMGITPECSHHEQGPGQNEIDFRYAGAMHTADNAMAFKSAVRTIAGTYGLCASFLPKPIEDQPGNGLHINLSIEKDFVNLFELQDGKLSQTAQHAMAGILKHIVEMTAFLNPLSNSYDRLGVHEAPQAVNWSFGNRSQLIRIPEGQQGSSRMELRSADPACNPYIVFALLLAAAMEGIHEELPLQPQVEATGMLPKSLKEALQLAESSKFIAKVLPEDIIQKYIAEKQRIIAKEEADPSGMMERHLKSI